MTVVTLSDEQVRLIGEATAPVVLVDARGHRIGRVTKAPALPPDAPEEEVVAEIKRRMAEDDGERVTHAEVMAHLRGLTSE